MKPLEQDMARTAGYLISEASGYRSREQGYMEQGSGVVKPGTVCAKNSATGKFKPLDLAAEATAEEGSETVAEEGDDVAVAVLFQGCDASETEVRRTFTVRDSEVLGAELIWPETITDEQKNQAIASLDARGIVVR